MRQLDQVLAEDSAFAALSEEEFMERWRPLLESLDRMFEDPQQSVPSEQVENTASMGNGDAPSP